MAPSDSTKIEFINGQLFKVQNTMGNIELCHVLRKQLGEVVIVAKSYFSIIVIDNFVILYLIRFVIDLIALSTLRRNYRLKFLLWHDLWCMRENINSVDLYEEEDSISETLRTDKLNV